MNIGKKLTFWTILAVLAVGILSAYVSLKMHVSRETDKLKTMGATVGGIVEAGLEHYMMNKDFTVLDKTLQRLGNMEPITGILLLNTEGEVKAATEKNKVGISLDRSSPACRVCHEKGTSGFYSEDDKIFKWVQPIRNKEACQGCHDASVRNNGILIIDFSVSEWEKEVRKDVLAGFSVFIPSLAVIGLVVLFLSRFLVISRLRTITQSVGKFRSGDYNVKVPFERKDEITDLAREFNEMAETISLRDKERSRWEVEIRKNLDIQSVINEILQVSLEHTPLNKILERGLDLILSVKWLSFESRGSIFLVEEDSQKLVMKAHKGLSSYIKEKCAIVDFGKCMCGRAAFSQKVQFADSLDERHEVLYEGISPHGHYCIPILISGRTIGVIAMYLEPGHKRDEMEERFLQSTANALAGIIQRKRMEVEREHLIEDLHITLGKVSHSQKMWQETFDSIGDLISIHDPDFNIIKVNRAFAENFGLDLRTVINKKCYEFFHGALTSCPKCPHVYTIKENKSLTVEVPDPKTGRIFLVSTFPFHFHDAEFHGTIHVARDITEEREKEMRLIMSERLASLGQMASGIAHEINNPLAAIAGCAEGLLNRVERGGYDPELFRNYLQIIEEEILRCKSITTSMLSFVRKTTYEKKVIDFNQMIDKTLEIIGFQGRLKNIHIESSYSGEITAVRGNEGELRQVFLAIITNALDAMKDDGTLTIETGSAENAVFAKVGDTGSGISEENINRVFDPFFTTKSDAGGTGLGLSIARKIISNHNGSIQIATEQGEGTIFKITLPLT
jgi:PAS domain S-box-containing protein